MSVNVYHYILLSLLFESCINLNPFLFYISEFIVSFKKFYNPETRVKFLQAALKSYEPDSWQILPRDNPASNFPSDFEVLQVLFNNKLFSSRIYGSLNLGF